MKNKKIFDFWQLALVMLIAATTGALASWSILEFSKPDTNQLIKQFYDTELAVHVSPHTIRKQIMAGNLEVTLVDLRSQQEYEREHVKGAINIPTYRDPDHPAYYDKDRIVTSFAALPKNKEVVVYCYSMPCMTGRKIGKLLSDNGIYVKHLGIGWNEWRYFWKLWNHEHEWNTTKAEDYITKGTTP
ncbi:MAG: rhodanese-like domain-containing protein [Candidatus Aenigmarchaeota archaeon]|nr:rhodanese-like domain-containing protein [Candidatus Aenigmarchaeota archaeon]